MGRQYAGILGLVAFAAMAVRGLLHGFDLVHVLPYACGALFAFAVIGYFAGQIGTQIVDDAIRSRFTAPRNRTRDQAPERSSG